MFLVLATRELFGSSGWDVRNFLAMTGAALFKQLNLIN